MQGDRGCAWSHRSRGPASYGPCASTRSVRAIHARRRVTRYNLASINHRLHAADNGRVIGYDHAHGYHHRHAFGQVEAVQFTCFEDVEARFEQDWIALRSPR